MARGGSGQPDGIKPELAQMQAAGSDDALFGTELTHFVPTVDIGSDDTWYTVWLPELGLSGSADSLDGAQEVLLENLGFYLDDVASGQATVPKSMQQLIADALHARAAGAGALHDLVFAKV